MAYYNQRVFGNPLQLLYTQNRAHYAVAPVFPWQAEAPANLQPQSHARLLSGWEPLLISRVFIPCRFAEKSGWKAYSLWLFYIGPH